MTKEEAIQDLKDILEEATSDKDAVCYVTSEDAEALNMAIEALQTDLVRCKVCKHQEFYYNDEESFFCKKTGMVNMHIDDGDGEFWCKYGERREP